MCLSNQFSSLDIETLEPEPELEPEPTADRTVGAKAGDMSTRDVVDVLSYECLQKSLQSRLDSREIRRVYPWINLRGAGAG